VICGLVGAFGAIDDKAKSMFRWMLYLDVFRGPHSTGIHMVDEKYNETTYKELGLPHNVWVSNPDVFTTDGIVKPDPVLLMGHNRWATKGEIIKENAHPFTFGHITGCHNGTLDAFDMKALKEGDTFEVDSKAIFRNIELDGVEPLWKDVAGAMALTWWDSDEGSLNIIRNAQRPLQTWFHDNCLFWASERWILEDARRFSGYVSRETPKELPINKLHTFYVDKDGKVVEEVESIAPFFAKFQGSSGGNYKSNITTIGGNTQGHQETVVEIIDFVAIHNNPHNIGHFVAKDLKIPNKEWVIQLYSESVGQSRKIADGIVEKSREGHKTYKLNTQGSWMYNGMYNTNWRHLTLLKDFTPEPSDGDVAKDKLGSEVEYGDFKNFMCEEGCFSCYKPIPTTEWKNIKNYVCLTDEGAILCPECGNHPELIEQCKDYIKDKQFNFMRNWS
jgi:hypothetical protein